MKRRGVTLVEILIASVITVMIVGSISSAFAMVVRHQLVYGKARSQFESSIYFEDQVRSLLAQCYYSAENPTTTYFNGDSTQGDSSVSDRLTFTVAGNRVPGDAKASTSEDFAERNESIGPVGGVTEVSLSTTPVGDAGARQGLFLRKQTPADGDPTQGGYESLLEADIATVTFEFYDSTTWIAVWDSATNAGLPSAVRVTYTLTSDPEVERTFVVKIPQASPASGQQGAARP